jgi:hypothetical protein
MIYEVPPDPLADQAMTETDLWGAARDRKPLPWPRGAPAGPDVPDAGNDDHTSLVCLLIHTARALARSQITIANGFDRITMCAACGAQALAGPELRHSPTCLSAEVTSIIERMWHSFSITPNRREVLASDAGKSCAGGDDERHPRSNYSEPWQFRIGSEPGTFELIDADNCTRAKVSGRYLERREVTERIVACVNYCAGNSTELLAKLKAAAGGQIE